MIRASIHSTKGTYVINNHISFKENSTRNVTRQRNISLCIL